MQGLNPQHETVFRELCSDREPPPPGEAFELAIEKRAVAEYLQGEISLDDLSDTVDEYADTIHKLRELRKRTRSSASDSSATETAIDHRSRALRDILALEAAADDAVVAFRIDNLEEGLLAMSNVDTWIRHIEAKEDPPTIWYTVPGEALSKGMSPDDPALNRLSGYSEQPQRVYYYIENPRRSRTAFTQLGGVLAELADTAYRIAGRYDWDEAAATVFILTGIPPTPRGARAQRVDPWPWPNARKRIVLDIPLTTTPDEVAARYRHLREEMVGDEPIGRRSLTKRSADLAVFAAEHSSGHTWNEAREIWNHHHAKANADWYTDPDKFIRDSRAAYKRVTGKDLDWIGKGARGTRTPRDESKEP